MAIVVVVAIFQMLLSFGKVNLPRVLGYAANISPTDVIRLTNEQRTAQGLSPLSENSTLDQAALAKGNDMLAKGYWAHFAPDGTTPWSFFLKFGYKYQYAGENLARDFSDSASAVNAWMNSPSHRENILNSNYKDIGIGVVEGSLAGSDTTIIVQFFGSPLGGSPSIPLAQAKEIVNTATPKPSPSPAPSPLPTPITEPVATVNATTVKPLFSPFESTKDVSLVIVGILLLVLSFDLILVRKKRIVRVGGRTLAHIAFFGMILAVILILKAGRII